LLLAALLPPALLFAEASPEWRLIGWFLAAITTGLTALLLLWRGGWPWLRHFAFPLFFILAAVPWPTSLEYKIMVPLMQQDAGTAVEILNWCGIPAIQHQNVIELPNGIVGVDEACSGIRSLQTSLMIALFAGQWMQLRLVRRAALLGAALALTYLFNVIRTLILVALSATWGDAMLHRWHDTIGLGVLVLSLVGLALLALWIREPRSPVNLAAAAVPAKPAPWPRAALLGFACWFLAAIAATQLWFDWHQARALPAARWDIVWPTALPTYEPVEIPVEARTSFMYSTEKSSAAKWQESSTASLWLGYFLRWDAGRETSIMASSHHPDVCLPATGKPLVADYGTSLVHVAGLTLPVQVYQFNDGGQPLFVFYCLWSDGPADDAAASLRGPTSSGWGAALRRLFLPFTPPAELDYRLHAIAEGRRNLGQQVLELGLWGAENVDDARKQYEATLPELVRRPSPQS
jgi:exosortase